MQTYMLWTGYNTNRNNLARNLDGHNLAFQVTEQDMGMGSIREGVQKKFLWNFPLRIGPHPPPLVGEKNPKNVLYVMKRILYDMGHLTAAKWLLQRALKFNIPFCPRS